MITIRAEGMKEVLAYLDDIKKRQLPFAVSKALNMTAKSVQAELNSTMKSVFDRPIPFTLNSIYIKPSTKDNLSVEVGHKDWAAKGTAAGEYLKPHIFGGNRSFKRSERRYGEYIMPSKFAPLDQYGNITKGKMTQIMSVTKMHVDRYQNTTKRSKEKNKKLPGYFISHGGRGLKAGIWQRYGRKNRSVKPIFFFSKAPQYQKRYPFFEVARKVVQVKFPRLFGTAMFEALRTARR